MRPYYEHAGITIYHGDCREMLPSVIAQALVTDPPYGINLGLTSGSGGRHGLCLDAYAFYVDTYENFVTLVVPALNAALERVARAAVFTGPHIHEQRKPDAIGGVYHPAACGRHLWGFKNFLPVLLYGKAPHLQRGARHTVIRSTATTDSKAIGHPVPKPLEWMLWLVDLASLPGEVVLDPFMGSGTTLVAAKTLGRCAIGIELEERYCEIAANRLRQEVLPLPMPEPSAEQLGLLAEVSP